MEKAGERGQRTTPDPFSSQNSSGTREKKSSTTEHTDLHGQIRPCKNLRTMRTSWDRRTEPAPTWPGADAPRRCRRGLCPPIGWLRLRRVRRRENQFGEFTIVVQAARLRSLYRQAGRLHDHWQRYFFAVPTSRSSGVAGGDAPRSEAGALGARGMSPARPQPHSSCRLPRDSNREAISLPRTEAGT